eukprot:TRINITY_DN9764_c0_g1_i3.p2 TRINITY_DN9764_c0_g1~~TRINITY_DN9764_c0_g1_i3.p2  ORF type:complete len:184 (-),score=33.78 TRINITY_DN9764_c0_g1_i3:83-559(-)
MVAEGDELPSVEVMEKSGDLVNVLELFKGKTGILFAVPGAFTPTCSQKHLPGFIEAFDELAAAGVDVIACLSVNDPWVMQAWGEQHGAEGKVRMLADIKCEFTKAMGMELDRIDKLGSIRSERYAAVVKDGKIARLTTGDASFAPEVLTALRAPTSEA